MNAHSTYPDMPGNRGVDTSIAAGDKIAKSLGYLQKIVQRAIIEAGPFGITTNELAEKLAIDRGTIQPRTSELKQKGVIRDSGARRRNANGKKAIVWVGWGAI